MHVFVTDRPADTMRKERHAPHAEACRKSDATDRVHSGRRDALEVEYERAKENNQDAEAKHEAAADRAVRSAVGGPDDGRARGDNSDGPTGRRDPVRRQGHAHGADADAQSLLPDGGPAVVAQ